MPCTYEDAVMQLLRLCEAQPGFADVDAACLIRDLKGRLRLVVKGGAVVDWSGLTTTLNDELSPWFFGPILRADVGSPDAKRLAQSILQQHPTAPRAWPKGWPTELPQDPPSPTIPLPGRWCGGQRLLTKESWLSAAPATPPWPLRPQTPTIVSFFSFKGGVGRTTALALTAYHLRRTHNRRVVLVDLDLEAPGLGALFGLPRGAGVVDALLEHSIRGSLSDDSLSRILHEVTPHGVPMQVIKAGDLNEHHLEKLGRLDYLGSGQDGESPVGGALRALLDLLKARSHAPEFILLDARAGLHDLGGLALHGLSHADVLVGRDNEQGREGMALTLSALTRRRAPADLRVFPMLTFVQGSPTDRRRKADSYFAELERLAQPHGLPLNQDQLMVIPDLGELGAPPSFDAAESPLLEHAEYTRLATSLEELHARG